MKKITYIKERVLYIAEYYNVSREKFFTNLGLKYDNYKGESKKTALTSDAISAIIREYDKVNPRWLILGEGDMIADNYMAVGEPIIEYNKREIEGCKLCKVGETEIQALLRENIRDKEKIINLQNELANCREELETARNHNHDNGQKRKAG